MGKHKIRRKLLRNKSLSNDKDSVCVRKGFLNADTMDIFQQLSHELTNVSNISEKSENI